MDAPGRCWGQGDARITCVACHEPHQPRPTDPAAYDTRCLSCHVTGKTVAVRDHPGRACPVGSVNCVTCHMPKYDVPWMHSKFTDHLIPCPTRHVPGRRGHAPAAGAESARDRAIPLP
jgi:hypothetical protein